MGRFAQSLVINHLESSDYCLKYMVWQFLYNFVIFEPTIMVQYSMECLFIELSNDVRNIIVVQILFELEIKVYVLQLCYAHHCSTNTFISNSKSICTTIMLRTSL